MSEMVAAMNRVLERVAASDKSQKVKYIVSSERYTWMESYLQKFPNASLDRAYQESFLQGLKNEPIYSKEIPNEKAE